MNDRHHPPLVEKLRPRNPSDLLLESDTIRFLEEMLESESPINLLFHGPSGSGKTSAARMFLTARGELGGMTIDAANNGSIDTVRKVIDGFASTLPFDDGLKVCFIDEAHHLSAAAQAALCSVIERCSPNCRFILATSELRKISAALRSRHHCVDFSLSPTAQNRDRAKALLINRLLETGVSIEENRLRQFIANLFPDLRSVNNAIAFETSAQRGSTFQMEQPVDND